MNVDDNLCEEWEDDVLFLFNEYNDDSSSMQSYADTQKPKGEIFFKQMDEDLDYAFALSLQTQYDDEVKENTDSNSKVVVSTKSVAVSPKVSKPLSIIDEQWELIDPHPDIHALFIEYDQKYFYGKLKGVEVRWSPRMTLCAGVCCYEGRGGLCSVRLSVPLLKLRPRKDLVETLLHEMIHAYLFVTHNNKDRDGHGPEFLSHMNRINKETGTRITVYHSFHDEVDVYRTHWWKCDGPCRNRRPFYGLVKRAMNRAPGPKDNWWAAHQATCGGKFIKIKEPENYGKKKTSTKKNSASSGTSGLSKNIKSFFNGNFSGSTSEDSTISKQLSTTKSSTISDLKSLLSNERNIVSVNKSETCKDFIPFQGTGHKLGGSSQPFYKTTKERDFTNKKRSLASGSPEETLQGKQLSSITKFLKTSSSANGRSPHKNQQPSTSSAILSSASKSLTQSSLENFLSPKSASDSKSSVHKDMNNIEFPLRGALKVACPVCFILIAEQDINSHLDMCLLKKE